MQLVVPRGKQKQQQHNLKIRRLEKGAPGQRGEKGVGFFASGLALLVCVSACTVPDAAYCSDDEDCLHIVGDSASAQICHPKLHLCIASDPVCFSDADCRSAGAPSCNKNHCEPCQEGVAGDAACSHFASKSFCGRDRGGATMCVACLKNLDCPESAPICDGQRCRKCQRHSDCEGSLHCEDGSFCNDSLVCIEEADFGIELAGRCARNGNSPSGHVVYVHDDGSGSCKDVDNPGTDVDHPFCSIDAASLTASAAFRTYVRVLAGRDYMPLRNPLRAGKVVFIGAPVPSREIVKQATINLVGQPLYVFDAADVTLDDFDLYQSMGNVRAVQCLLTSPGSLPRFTLRNSVVRGNTSAAGPHTMPAIDLDNCRAIIAGNVIGLSRRSDLDNPALPAHSLGLRIAHDPTSFGASFLVENNVIAGNWDVGVDLYRVASTGVTLRFNTVVGNGRRGVSGGIHCPSFTPVSIDHSIITGNGASAQFQDAMQCRFKQVVVGRKETLLAQGLISEDPLLGEFFELGSGSQNDACCIDKAQPAMDEIFPSIDLRRLPRPQGQAWDLGAYELSSGM